MARTKFGEWGEGLRWQGSGPGRGIVKGKGRFHVDGVKPRKKAAG